MLTQSKLKELLHYCPDTGVFTWAKKPSSRILVGSIAGSNEPNNGYIGIIIKRKRYRAHRLAWLYVHGYFPENHIDHINRVKNDNRIVNLREATHSLNQRNVGITSKNTSGHIGVNWHKQSNSWVARIAINKKHTWLGSFATIEEAISARLEGEARLGYLKP